MLITIVFETQNYKLKISKIGESEDFLKHNVELYWNEAHYPQDLDITFICKDLKETLELEECSVL